MATRYQFVDDSGETRLAGTLVPDPGANRVTCYVSAVGINVETVDDHDLKWNNLFDNPWDTNHLTAIPSGLGLSFLFDGSSAYITADESGTWALSFDGSVGTDATWSGTLLDSFAGGTVFAKPKSDAAFIASHCPTYSIPAGAEFAPKVSTWVAPTLDGVATVNLVIVRLA